jgi:PQQ-dependent catabolism-associated CXXCW motif protein
MRHVVLALTTIAAIAATSAAADDVLPEGVDPDTGFRMQRYRAPVPDFLPGGKVFSVDDVKALVDSETGAILIDVYPPRGAGPDPLDGTWRISETRRNIEGSTWLPDVGRGFLESGLDAYFRRNLARLTEGDQARPLVFYCTADCWQGWNAARRAVRLGYEDVAWFPLGTDGWRDRGLPVVKARPANFLEE